MANSKSKGRCFKSEEDCELSSRTDRVHQRKKQREVPVSRTRYSYYSNSQLILVTENKNLNSLGFKELEELNEELDYRLKAERIFL